jgi:uncharacterized protein
MLLPITSITAGILAVLFIALAYRVSGFRRGRRIIIGDGGDKEVARAIRVHGNLAEYLPLSLVLLALQELQGFPRWWLWTFCGALIVARLLHAYGMSQVRETFLYRIVGTTITYTLILASGIALVVNALR